MKKKLLYAYLLILGLLMAGCSSDSEVTTESPTPADGMVQVKLHLSTGAVTRAWTDTNAEDAEMMNIWVVVITNNSNVVEKVIACKPTGTEREIDPIVSLPIGTHNFYSFANMSVAKVAQLLGITVTMPTMTNNDEIYTAEIASGTVDANKAVTVNGNNFTALTSSDNNGFDSYGIPMSNVQTANISSNTTMDLVVVRMLAKMKVTVKNETGAAQYIKYASITGITDNVDNNLKLLPNYTTASSANTMEAVHGDIRPNLNGTPATVELAIPGMATTEALANNATREVTFYINECKAGTEFYLTIGLGDDSSTQEYRYALINQKGATTADDDKWDYIARNDYRIIPIILDDYKFEIIPYDFPPIGVYPVSVSEVDTYNHIYNFTFHDYGHFHLLPHVTKGGTTQVKYNVGSGDYWTLNTDWAGSWTTYDVKGGTQQTSGNYNGFYRNQTATADGDDVGGVPYWYLNDGDAGPQWDPSASGNYEPFIFGYIADPGGTMAADKKIYHEMKIQLYVEGNYRRDMTYRFYMTLSSDQMLYAPALYAGPRHTHILH